MSVRLALKGGSPVGTTPWRKRPLLTDRRCTARADLEDAAAVERKAAASYADA